MSFFIIHNALKISKNCNVCTVNLDWTARGTGYLLLWCKISSFKSLESYQQYSVSVNFWHGSGSLDPYTGVRIRFQILLFLAVLTINEFFHNYIWLFLTVGTLISVLKDDISLRSHKIVENHGLSEVFCSVADPESDPDVFGSPGFGSISRRSGSGSFNHQAKIVGKTLILTVPLKELSAN